MPDRHPCEPLQFKRAICVREPLHQGRSEALMAINKRLWRNYELKDTLRPIYWHHKVDHLNRQTKAS